jgi:hypothetical protein
MIRADFSAPLPIDSVLDEVRAALRAKGRAVLVAPPGAGKTTRVPLALLDEQWRGKNNILVLEPRRIAARAAAERMAATLGSRLGDDVGLRARLSSKTSPRVSVEVVTEGVFTRMILDDPELKGVAAILFDEFHERSLDADLGLRKRNEPLRFGLVPKAIADTGLGPAGAPAPLICRRARNPHSLKARDADVGLEARHARQPAVDNDANAFDGERRFRDRRRQNDLAPSRSGGRDGAILRRRIERAVERHDVDCV